MSRSKKDGRHRGGHGFPGYDVENKVVKDMTRRERRRANKKYAAKSEQLWEEDEEFEPDPERSSQGWRTW